MDSAVAQLRSLGVHLDVPVSIDQQLKALGWVPPSPTAEERAERAEGLLRYLVGGDLGYAIDDTYTVAEIRQYMLERGIPRE